MDCSACQRIVRAETGSGGIRDVLLEKGAGVAELQEVSSALSWCYDRRNTLCLLACAAPPNRVGACWPVEEGPGAPNV